MSQPSETCSRHPDEPLTHQCRDCRSRRCTEGVDERRFALQTAWICTSCGGRCRPVKMIRKEREQRSFDRQISSAFVYPLQQGRWIGLVVVGLWFGFFIPGTLGMYGQITQFPPLNALFLFLSTVITTSLFLLTVGYVVDYGRRVVNYTATFHEQPPLWFGFRDPLRCIWQAVRFITFLSLILFPVIFWWIGSILTGVSLSGVQYGTAAFMIPVLIWAPFCLLGYLILDSFTVLHPWFLFSVIRATGRTYGLLIGLTTTGLLIILGSTVLLDVPYAGGLTWGVLTLYLVMVQARLLGLFYRASKKDLNGPSASRFRERFSGVDPEPETGENS